MSCAWIGADLLQDENVSSVLLESDRVGFDVAQDSVEVVLIYTKKLTAVFPSNDSRRSANEYERKNYNFSKFCPDGAAIDNSVLSRGVVQKEK